MREPSRPDPDALLRRVQAESDREARARLKVFFGFAPGVGKTYAMLESARRLRAEGVDVVVGCVETHGRSETAALLDGLQVWPRRRVEYRGTTLEELDLAGILLRRPAVVLIDELAHTNAPGSRHKKRWQDVTELLEAGIEVHTTLNVQHLEALNDVVAQVTSVRVRETVPDSILERADEIELIDLPPDELLLRLKEGKVYVPEHAERAAESFFRRGNLLALRELALRRTAERVEAEAQAYRAEHSIQGAWGPGERILVCVGPGPGSARLVRAACRFAVGLRVPWVAAFVLPTGAPPVSEADRGRIDDHLRLAESLGGEVVQLAGRTISEALLAYARQRSVTRIIIGKPTHWRLRDLLRGSLLDELVRGSGPIDVQVIAGDDAALPSPPPKAAPPFSPEPYFAGLIAIGVATLICALADNYLENADVVMIYLLAIISVSLRYARAHAFFASALSVAAYDFFFIAPRHTFAIGNTRHLLTFGMMFGIGLVISDLMLRLRRQEEAARGREAGATALLRLTRALGEAETEASIARTTADLVGEVGAGKAVLLLASEEGQLRVASDPPAFPIGALERGVAEWTQGHARPAGWDTDTLPGAPVVCFPMRLGPQAIGTLAFLPDDPGRRLDAGQRHLVDAILRQTAVVIERSRLAEAAKAATLRARTEELRSSLLSTVSHDLRTPLAAITGAATTLLEPERLALTQRQELLETIAEEAERLERLVSNLLEMTRLESGGLVVKREWVPIEEVIGAALGRLEKKLEGHSVTNLVPADLPLVAIDPVLFEQVFLNLIDNITKYSPPDSPIEIEARVVGEALEVELRDRGLGIPAGDEGRLFDKFYRGAHGGIAGSGLGLAIVRGIVEAHGGTISARNRPGGGSIFCIHLPRLEAAPTVPPEVGG